MVSPSNGKAILGTIIRDIGAKPAKCQLAIQAHDEGGVDEVRRMTTLPWEGQTSRRGGITPTQPETAEAARAAVLPAAVLVQFCVGGCVRARVSGPAGPSQMLQPEYAAK